jgi:hypothetical protein
MTTMNDIEDVEDKLTLEEMRRLHFRFHAEHASHLADLYGTFNRREPLPFGQREIAEARGVAEAWNRLADRIERAIADRAAKRMPKR